MFPNLEAEQARNGHTNEYVARELSMSRQLYELRKKIGNFKLAEINLLVAMYKVPMDYLFSTEAMPPMLATAEPQQAQQNPAGAGTQN